MRDFNGLKVWVKAHALTLRVYQLTHDFPGEERAGLTEEIRRAARAVPSAVVEGCGQPEDRDMVPFLDRAVGATMALEYAVILARDLGYLPEATHMRTVGEIFAVRKLLLSARAKLDQPASCAAACASYSATSESTAGP